MVRWSGEVFLFFSWSGRGSVEKGKWGREKGRRGRGEERIGK